MKKTALILGMSAFAMGSTFAADPATIDWSKIPAANVPLFYPGQSSYEWVRSPAHKGAGGAKRGDACVQCHNGKEQAWATRSSKADRSSRCRSRARTATST